MLSLVKILPIVPDTTPLVVTLAVTSSGVIVGVTSPTIIVVVLLTQLVGVAVVQIL